MKKNISTLTIIIVLSLLFIGTYNINVLQILINDNGPKYNKVIYQEPVNNHEFFSVHWIHSVSLRPVIETYKIENNNLISIHEMIFDTFSSNLPSSPEYNTRWEYSDERIRVYNYDISFNEVPVVIGKLIADHTLYFKDDVVRLKDIYRPGGFVKIRVMKISLKDYILTKLIKSYASI